MVASLAALTLPPLPDFNLPPVPPIADATLKLTVFTHSSWHQSTRNAQALSIGHKLPEDYEKLEHVGDGILGVLVTLLLQDLYPNLPSGSATILKAHLVNNQTLAQICNRERLMENLRAAPSTLYTVKGQVKAQASVFEAYIAGLFYDFLRSPVPGGYKDGGKSVVTIDGGLTRGGPSSDGVAVDEGTETSALESVFKSMALPPLNNLRERTNGQAMDYVAHFVRPIFSPLAHFAFDFMNDMAEELNNSKGARGDDEPASDSFTRGAAAGLNAHCIQVTGQMPQYSYMPKGVNLWECECVVNTDGMYYESAAVRSTKKAAMGVAAWKIGKQLGLRWACVE
ncbi:hypothetical protein CspeluHIS016_0103360 [Cutaneotrichosporon spelunceum]|uniref:RNase III domain-containing protein n=1 Tax=Cutaneotrichosporon spelunceum TaxID=1672016 RepID=A0AAD3Y7M9_9TREE|nr:hypothetical protein CspeluHIS016_0103360 [Cutaneotrichosporon spelunceum]